jgi:hypothetical protein
MRLAVGVVLLAAGCPGGAGGGDTSGSTGEPGSTGSPASTGGVTTGSAPTTGPGACMASDVFSFCSAAPRLGRPPDESTLIAQLAAQYPNELNRCARHNDEFKRLALAALREPQERGRHQRQRHRLLLR